MKETIQTIENTVKEEATSLLETARKVLLASVGAVVMAGESAEKQVNTFVKDVETFVGKLVERGEIAEKDGRELVAEVVEKRKSVAKELTSKVRETTNSAETSVSNVTGRFDGIITRLNVPTKSDIDTLTKKISTLSRKVDQLKKAQEAAAAKPATKAVAAKNGTPKATASTKAAPKKTAAKKTAAKKTAAKKTVAKKAAPKKTTAKKAAPKSANGTAKAAASNGVVPKEATPAA